MELDANTAALYRFNESSGTAVADDTGVYGATAAGGSLAMRGARLFSRSASGYAFALGDTALRNIFKTLGIFTVEAWVWLNSAGGSYNTILTVATSTGASELWGFALQGALPYWERDAGGAATSGPDPISLATWTHVAWTRDGAGAIKLHVNGVLKQTDSGVALPSTAATTQGLLLGAGPGGPDRFFDGVLGEVRVSSVARSTAELLASASETPPSLDASAPVISNVSPAAGSVLTRNQAWGFRVTDDVALRRIVVVATLNDSDGTERAKEVVYDGAAFAAAYSGTKTTIASGTTFDFSIQRIGGWPYAPTFDVFAIDTSGNEGT